MKHQYLQKPITELNSNLKSSFQAGVDTLYNKCVNCGSTPSSKTPTAIESSIGSIYTNRYNSGYNAGDSAGYTRGYNAGKNSVPSTVTSASVVASKTGDSSTLVTASWTSTKTCVCLCFSGHLHKITGSYSLIYSSGNKVAGGAHKYGVDLIKVSSGSSISVSGWSSAYIVSLS